MTPRQADDAIAEALSFGNQPKALMIGETASQPIIWWPFTFQGLHLLSRVNPSFHVIKAYELETRF